MILSDRGYSRNRRECSCSQGDWSRFVEIESGDFSDRFEVISLGALNNSMSVEKMMAGQWLPRNTIITGVLRDYG